MPVYVFDTNAVGRMMADDEAYESRLGRIGEGCVISVITRGEIRYGLNRLPLGKRRNKLVAKAEKIFAALDALPVTETIADKYGHLRRELEAAGTSCDGNDLWIAATCLVEGAVLVSRDGVFKRIPRLQVEAW